MKELQLMNAARDAADNLDSWATLLSVRDPYDQLVVWMKQEAVRLRIVANLP